MRGLKDFDLKVNGSIWACLTCGVKHRRLRTLRTLRTHTPRWSRTSRRRLTPRINRLRPQPETRDPRPETRTPVRCRANSEHSKTVKPDSGHGLSHLFGLRVEGSGFPVRPSGCKARVIKFISQNVSCRLVFASQPPHKIVNLLFTITN